MLNSDKASNNPNGCLYVVISMLASIVCSVSLLMRFREYESALADIGFLILFTLLNVILIYVVAAAWYFRPKSLM